VKVSPRDLGLVLVVLGLAVVVFGAFLAYAAYVRYRPVLPSNVQSLSEAITGAAFELLNLVVRLGFLGAMIWAGGLVIKHGSTLIIEAYRVDRGVEVRSEQRKQES